MSRNYTPRRAGKRWLAGAPEYILDCLDDRKEHDRYTILFTGSLLGRMGDSKEFKDTYVMYLGLDSDARSSWGELNAYDAAQFRYRNGRHRIKWLDLPEEIRKQTILRATRDFES